MPPERCSKGALTLKTIRFRRNFARKPGPLPDIPTCDSMRSIVMTHKFGDLFNPPGLTNQWGCAQAAMDVVAVRSIAFPPFAQGEMNVAPLGRAVNCLHGVLFVDEEYFASTKTPIEFVWQPDRVERKTVYKGLEIIERRWLCRSKQCRSRSNSPSKTFPARIEKPRSNSPSTAARRNPSSPGMRPIRPANTIMTRTIDNARNAVFAKSKTPKHLFCRALRRSRRSLMRSWITFKFDLAPNETKSISFCQFSRRNANGLPKNIMTRITIISTRF